MVHPLLYLGSDSTSIKRVSSVVIDGNCDRLAMFVRKRQTLVRGAEVAAVPAELRYTPTHLLGD